MRIIGSVFLLLIILAGVAFACLNATPVSVNYYLGSQQLPLSLLLVIVFAVGALLGVIVSIWPLLKLKAANFRLRQRIKLAEKEVENLRAIPLKNDH